MRKQTLVVALLLLAVSSALAEPESNKFESVTAGFSVTKPAEWRFASLEQVAQNRATARLKDEELQKLVQQQANAPLVVIMKHDEPFDGLNPSFQVILRPRPQSLASATAKQILELVVPTLQKGFADYQLLEPIREFKLSGHDAAEAVATYTARNQEGGEFPTKGRMIIVPRGQFMFLISASAPPEGPDASVNEFDSILKSVIVGD